MLGSANARPPPKLSAATCLWLSLCLGALASCATNAQRSGESVARESRAEPVAKSDVTKGPGDKLETGPVLVGVAGTSPDWFEPTCKLPKCGGTPWRGRMLLGQDEETALERTLAGELLVTSRTRGVIGPVATPGRLLWAKPSVHGRILAGDEQGKLWSATTADLASGLGERSWKRLKTKVRGYVADVNGERVIMADRDIVHIGTWKLGHVPKFTSSVPRKGIAVKHVWVRSDGVGVAALNRGSERILTMVKAPSARWKTSPFQGDLPVRWGDLIAASTAGCHGALSRDPKQWTTKFNPPPRHSWRDVLEVTTVPASGQAMNLAIKAAPAPPAPTNPAFVARTETKCPSRPSGGPSFDLMSMSTVTKCSGWDCLRGTRIREASTALIVGFFGDGVCAPGTKACGRGDSFSRPPSAALGSRRSGRFVVRALPKGCREPLRLDSVRGLAVLFCKSSTAGSDVYTATLRDDTPPANVRFRFEGRLAGFEPTREPASGPDGTVLTSMPCAKRGDPCIAWVRQPLPSGTPDAWRRISVPGAMAFRVGLQGRVLVISDDPVQRLSVVGPTTTRTLAYREAAPFHIRLTSEGRVELRSQNTKTGGGKKRQLWLDGTAR